MKLIDRIEDKWLFAGMTVAFSVSVASLCGALWLVFTS